MAGMQNILAWVAGAWMIVMGLVAAGLVPMRKKTAPSDTASSGGGLFVSILRPIFVSPTPTAALMLGVATGFLPCPIVAGFLAMALESASVPAGMAVMAGLGVGSCWSLLLLGLTGGAIRARFGRWSSIIGAAVLILLGTATLLRGTDAFHRLMGCSDASCGATENPACHCKTMAATNTSSQPASAPSSMSSAPPVVCPHCRTDSTSQTAPTSRP
jgi:sulfite exporter TauE/SafE